LTRLSRNRCPNLRRRVAAIVLPLILGACSGDDALGPNASIASLVGDWRADRFVVRNKANPAQSAELIRDLGAQFTLNVQPSGQYTAVLVYQGTPITEIGLLDVEGNEIVFTVSIPTPATSRARYTATSARLTLDGDTQFDFNLDGRPDPAEAHIELTKR
jgi:hypothetical protein